MRRIAVILSKGGVGKSTVAVNLAHGLARAGQRVALVDCDSQGQCAKLLGVTPERGLAEVLSGTSVEGALLEARPGLWLLAGGRGLSGVRREIDRRDIAAERTLATALWTLSDFDVMLIDTSPAWDALAINVLYASSEVLCPVAMDPLAADALKQFQLQLEDLRPFMPALRLRYVTPTFVDGRVARSAEILSLLQDTYRELVTPPIRYSTRLAEAAAFGMTAFEYDPGGRGAQDFAALVERVRNDAT
jgi:chromosome partitioning protein